MWIPLSFCVYMSDLALSLRFIKLFPSRDVRHSVQKEPMNKRNKISKTYWNRATGSQLMNQAARLVNKTVSYVFIRCWVERKQVKSAGHLEYLLIKQDQIN